MSCGEGIVDNEAYSLLVEHGVSETSRPLRNKIYCCKARLQLYGTNSDNFPEPLNPYVDLDSRTLEIMQLSSIQSSLYLNPKSRFFPSRCIEAAYAYLLHNSQGQYIYSSAWGAKKAPPPPPIRNSHLSYYIFSINQFVVKKLRTSSLSG